MKNEVNGVKRINKIGMFHVVDTIRTICKDMLDKMQEFKRPYTDADVHILRNDLTEMIESQLQYLETFHNNKEWEVRDNDDDFNN